MPIHKMSYEDGVFIAKAVGYFDNVDGRMWATALRNHAKNDYLPLAAVIDIAEVNRICPTVIKTITDSMRISNFSGIGLVVDSSMASINARALEKLIELPNVRIFYTREEAYRYARNRLNSGIGSAYAATYRAMAFAF